MHGYIVSAQVRQKEQDLFHRVVLPTGAGLQILVHVGTALFWYLVFTVHRV